MAFIYKQNRLESQIQSGFIKFVLLYDSLDESNLDLYNIIEPQG